jgi:TonB family protein
MRHFAMTDDTLASRPQQPAVRELDFGRHSTEPASQHRRVMVRACAVALVVHGVAIVGLISAHRSDVVRVGPAAADEGISAFVFPAPRPTGTTGIAKPAERPVRPARRTQAPDGAQTTPASVAEAGSGEPTDSVAPQGDTPVCLGAGAKLGLLKKVDPVYPVTMQAAGVDGVVVLDAVIHRDGTIGDITILKASAPAFEQAAIDAVKQWRYTPLPYEGIVTVTLNFKGTR